MALSQHCGGGILPRRYRGWKPLPQGRDLIVAGAYSAEVDLATKAGSHSHKGTDGMAQRAISCFQVEWSILRFSGSTLFEALEIFFAVDTSRS
jgi:hypothetical protein